MRTRTLTLFFFLPVLVCSQPVISAVVNGASYSEALAPGCWMTIYGINLAPAPLNASHVPLPRSLNGVSLTVDGTPSALLYVSPTQVNALIPVEVQTSGFRKVPVVVTSASGVSNTFSIYLNRNAPALFTRNSAGTGRAHMFDPTFRSVDVPAAQDVVILYATGLGPTDPPASSDSGATGASHALDNVEVFLGEQQAEVLYAGLAPGFPGVYQVNVRVPTLWTDRLYLRQRGWISNVVQVGVAQQTNVANVTGSIQAVLPSASSAVTWSLAFLGARFETSFDVLPGARTFLVAAVGEAGGWFARVDPANGMFSGYQTVPTLEANRGDFSKLPSPVADFMSGCQPFPNNQIPSARLDPAFVSFVQWLPPPDLVFQQYAVGTLEYNQPLFAGGRFSPSGSFGDFLQIPCGTLKSGKTTFTLYVDGKAVASQDVTYQIGGR